MIFLITAYPRLGTVYSPAARAVFVFVSTPILWMCHAPDHQDVQVIHHLRHEVIKPRSLRENVVAIKQTTRCGLATVGIVVGNRGIRRSLRWGKLACELSAVLIAGQAEQVWTVL